MYDLTAHTSNITHQTSIRTPFRRRTSGFSPLYQIPYTFPTIHNFWLMITDWWFLIWERLTSYITHQTSDIWHFPPINSINPIHPIPHIFLCREVNLCLTGQGFKALTGGKGWKPWELRIFDCRLTIVDLRKVLFHTHLTSIRTSFSCDQRKGRETLEQKTFIVLNRLDELKSGLPSLLCQSPGVWFILITIIVFARYCSVFWGLNPFACICYEKESWISNIQYWISNFEYWIKNKSVHTSFPPIYSIHPIYPIPLFPCTKYTIPFPQFTINNSPFKISSYIWPKKTHALFFAKNK